MYKVGDTVLILSAQYPDIMPINVVTTIEYVNINTTNKNKIYGISGHINNNIWWYSEDELSSSIMYINKRLGLDNG